MEKGREDFMFPWLCKLALNLPVPGDMWHLKELLEENSWVIMIVLLINFSEEDIGGDLIQPHHLKISLRKGQGWTWPYS